MVKTNLCDLCIMKDIITIAKYSTSTAVKGNRISICTGHRIEVKKIASDANKVITLLSEAIGKANTLRV